VEPTNRAACAEVRPFPGPLPAEPGSPLGLQLLAQLGQLLGHRIGIWLTAFGGLQAHGSGHLGTPVVELLLQSLPGVTLLGQIRQQGFPAAGTARPLPPAEPDPAG
jgi:hypothetical protein